MTEAEWINSLRKRTHDLANDCQRYEVELVRLDGRIIWCEERMKEITEIQKSVVSLNRAVTRLHHDSKVLRWLLGVITTIGIGILIKLA